MTSTPPLDHISARPSQRWWTRKRIWLPIAALMTLAMLLFDITPSVPAATPLSAAQVKAAKRAFDRTRSMAGRDLPAPLTFSWEELSAATTLGGRAAHVDRVSIAPADGAVVVQASVPIAMLWINLAATVEPSAAFPPFTARIGRLPLPRWTNRPLLWLAEKFLAWRGATVPPLSSIVSGLSLNSDGVTARVKLPSSSNLSAAMQTLEADPLNPAQVASIYCKLATATAAGPPLELSDLLNFAFADFEDASSAQNRAALVALAMLVDSRKLGDLVGDARARTERCKANASAVTLAGRGDLAKHWAVSAALTAALGADVSAAMGQWKEVSDSAPQGSGFSFVDLAADRSGVYYATRASSPEDAAETARALAAITQDQLLPRAALLLVEGLTEPAFRARFGSTDDEAYRAVTKQLDAILAGGR